MRNFDRAVKAVAALELIGENRKIAAYWLSCWSNDRPPSRGRFDLAPMTGCVPAISVFEIREPDEYRCIKSGVFYEMALGYSLEGQNILSLTNAPERAQRFAFGWEIAKGAVTRFYLPMKSQKHGMAMAQCTSLPFSDVKADGSRYFMMHSGWRPQTTDWIIGNVSSDVQMPEDRLLISFLPPPAEAAA